VLGARLRLTIRFPRACPNLPLLLNFHLAESCWKLKRLLSSGLRHDRHEKICSEAVHTSRFLSSLLGFIALLVHAAFFSVLTKPLHSIYPVLRCSCFHHCVACQLHCFFFLAYQPLNLIHPSLSLLLLYCVLTSTFVLPQSPDLLSAPHICLTRRS
jgi:hypothetical protein